MNHYKFIDHNKVQFDFIVQEGSESIPTDTIKNLGGRIYEIPSYKNLPKYMEACKQIFMQTQPDIVHSNMNALSLFPLRAAMDAHIPVRIAHSHSTDNPNEILRTSVKRLLRPMSKLYPTHLAACGILSGEWLFGKKAVEKGEVHFIHNAIDLQNYTFNENQRHALRASIGITDNQLVIGQIGRFSSQKNQIFSIDVFKEVLKLFPNAVLVFLGIGDTLDEVKTKAASLNLQDKIHFMGLQSNANYWYSAFDVLLFPSLYEGLPLTAIEAQAAGLPIVASDHITPEAFINTDLVSALSLRDSPQRWAKQLITSIHNTTALQRDREVDTLRTAGYEIRDSAHHLEQWYQTIVS